MWQAKNTLNIIDYRIVASYYYLISCECGYEGVVIKRRYADKRIARVIRDHACEREGKGKKDDNN
jgi:hypothetical protein